MIYLAILLITLSVLSFAVTMYLVKKADTSNGYHKVVMIPSFIGGFALVQGLMILFN